jgi:hypothetical protein
MQRFSDAQLESQRLLSGWEESQKHLTERWLHSSLGRFGFCAEFVGLLKVAMMCHQHHLQLVLPLQADSGWCVGGRWNTFFRATFPTIEVSELLHRVASSPVRRWHNDAAVGYLRRSHSLGGLTGGKTRTFLEGIGFPANEERDYWFSMRNIARALSALNDDSSAKVIETISRRMRGRTLPARYVAVHVRRGDKISEVRHTSLEVYAAAIRRERADLNDLIVFSDDRATAEQLCDMLRDTHQPIIFSDLENGHNQTKFNIASRDVRSRLMIEFLAELEVMAASTMFFGTESSNIFSFLRYRRANLDCVRVDCASA